METQNIEYKVKWKDEFLHYISGFANAEGGTLFIGKDDNGNIVGIDNTKYLLENLPNKAVQATGIVCRYISISIPIYSSLFPADTIRQRLKEKSILLHFVAKVWTKLRVRKDVTNIISNVINRHYISQNLQLH